MHWDSLDATGSYSASRITIEHSQLQHDDASISVDGTLTATSSVIEGTGRTGLFRREFPAPCKPVCERRECRRSGASVEREASGEGSFERGDEPSRVDPYAEWQWLGSARQRDALWRAVLAGSRAGEDRGAGGAARLGHDEQRCRNGRLPPAPTTCARGSSK